MPGKSTIDPIFCVEQLIEKYREKRKNLTIVFVGPEKAYERVLRKVIQKMFEAIISVKSVWEKNMEFMVKVGVHQNFVARFKFFPFINI